MTPRRRPGPQVDPIATGLYAVRWGVPQAMVPGDAMRGTPCLICGRAIGAGPATTVVVTYYAPDRLPAGNLPCSAWLAHASHPRPEPRGVHGLAEWRLATIGPAQGRST